MRAASRWVTRRLPTRLLRSRTTSTSPFVEVGEIGGPADVAAWAALEPHPRSVQYLISTVDPVQIWSFLQTEMPIRYAERIRSLEHVPHWNSVQDLLRVHDVHTKSFEAFRKADVHSSAQVAHEAILREQGVVEMLAKSVHQLRHDYGESISETFLSKFLDDFLLNRIGCQVLLGHFLACRAGQKSGIIDPECNTKKVCRAAAKTVSEMCVECTGCSPKVQVEAFSSCGGGLDDDSTPKFPYMPHVLKYVVMELLKNSCRATADLLKANPSLCAEDRPINVIICADEDHVTICVADRAQGIPRGVNAWSYLYTTAKDGAYAEKRLAGHGVGLPLSRLYARYLGGALDLVSLPGYGTHAYVNLPRVQSQQVEVVPDRDYNYDHASLLDFTV